MLSNIPEIWGGIECSYTRTNNLYGDQLAYCGHYTRGVSDLHKILALGIKAMRYPVLWEKNHQGNCWQWVERQLNILQDYGVTPIAGLVHHGSGPAHATLIDPCFPDELKKYAALVARKFSHLEYFTPINEPLTTARFGALYGIWYPHQRDAKSFAEMFLTEMKAIVLSMYAIREINPEAKLIQTEDLGKTYSTPLLHYQAEFENHRRWLTNDLLCGYVKPGHPMWDYFLWLKVSQKKLEFFLENPCRPDIIGIDYYLTSERFLDDNLEKYHPNTYGSNGKHAYADIEAIRVKHNEPFGPAILFRECWDRYHLPMAITEVHVHGSPAEQIAWFNYIWKTCVQLRQQGCDIRAVTAWAILGTHGWSSLLTEKPGEYERGVFDMSSGSLKATPYTGFLKALIRYPEIAECYDTSGWWSSDDRFIRPTQKTSITSYTS